MTTKLNSVIKHDIPKSIWGNCKLIKNVSHNHIKCTCPKCLGKNEGLYYLCVLSNNWITPAQIITNRNVYEISRIDEVPITKIRKTK